MHFITKTGAALALTATLATSSPITKRQTSIDPSKQFQIIASSIPAPGTNSGISFNLTPYYTSSTSPKTLALQATNAGSSIANFTMSADQLILYSAATCDQYNACTPPEKYGDLYPAKNSILNFQEGLASSGDPASEPETGGFAINGDNEVVVSSDGNAVQFYMCETPVSADSTLNLLRYEAEDSDCTPVQLVAQQ